MFEKSVAFIQTLYQLKQFTMTKLTVFAFCVLIIGCTGKQGDPGPAGAVGANGTNGSPTLGSMVGAISLLDTQGQPLADFSGANVALDNTNISATTRTDGTFTIGNVPAGTYDITFTKAGFGTSKAISVVYAGGPASIYILANGQKIMRLAQFPIFTISNFTVNISSGNIVASGTNSSSGQVIFFAHTTNTVSNLNYTRLGASQPGQTSFSNVVVTATSNFASGSTVYVIAYPLNSSGSEYFSIVFNKSFFTAVGTPTLVVPIVIP